MTRSLATLIGALILTVTAASLSAQRGIGVGLASAPALSQPIRVDCTQGESLQRALDAMPQSTTQMTIEIHGFCQEPITIERKVIIRGTNSQTDGIAGPSIGSNTALVVVFGVNGFGPPGSESVRLEHLTIKDSPSVGISVNAAQLSLTDVVIRDNGSIGLGAFPASYVSATDLTVMDNAGAGLFSRSRILCTNCTLINNGPTGNAGIAADQAGKVIFVNSSLTGTAGIQSSSAADITVIGGTINATTRAVMIQNGGQVFFREGTQISGSVICRTQGILDSRAGAGTAGFTQLSNASGGNNTITNGCFFLAGPGVTTLTGSTFVTAGGWVSTEGPPAATTVKFQALGCSGGGKVVGATVVVNNVSGIPTGCVP